jgi:amidohydrolase
LELSALKASIIAEVDARREELLALSHTIHANPEPGFRETKACALLGGFLEEHGFAVTRGIAGLDTAFKAVYGQGSPDIAFLAEYDALPGLGHACGHNIIAASAMGAAVASKQAVYNYGGSVTVIGTPAEESGGGKAVMAEQGVFSELDAAIMIHPGSRNLAAPSALAAQGLQVEFFGKEAHAAANPQSGVNALDALILSFNALNALRQHIPDDCRIHGIITDGGAAHNIVPAHSAASFMVRAATDGYLDILKEKTLDCFRSGAQATGARLEYHWHEIHYAALKPNATLTELFMDNMKTVGRKFTASDPSNWMGSTDMGNVSQIVPGLHALVAIAPPDVTVHTPEFARTAISETGDRCVSDAAKAMAMTLADLLADPDTRKRLKDDFL